MRIADHTGGDASGRRNETRGPEQVAITTTLDAAPLFDVDYTLEYERDNTYYGDKRCGFCDSSEHREHEL